MKDGECLVQLYDSDDIAFLGRNGQRVADLQEAMIFTDGLAAQLYIEKNRLNRIGRIRMIVSRIKIRSNYRC